MRRRPYFNMSHESALVPHVTDADADMQLRIVSGVFSYYSGGRHIHRTYAVNRHTKKLVLWFFGPKTMSAIRGAIFAYTPRCGDNMVCMSDLVLPNDGVFDMVLENGVATHCPSSPLDEEEDSEISNFLSSV